MPLNPDYIENRVFEPVRHHYHARDTMLYAVGVGVARDLDRWPEDLKYVYEPNLAALPTLAVVLAQPGFWVAEPEAGIDWHNMLHTGQFLKIHKQLPAQGEVVGQTRIAGLYDKGAGKGCIMVIENELRDASTDELLVTCGFSTLLRTNGGFGGTAQGIPEPWPTPESEPELTLEFATRPEQAFVYRLSGDYNPLHVDPAVADIAGFERPILHGLCTYGVTCRGVLKLLCDNDPSRLRVFNTRFSSPVYPGETLRVEVWRQQPGVAAVQTRVVERDVVVMRNGYVEYE
jgi:acyl dehydratase